MLKPKEKTTMTDDRFYPKEQPYSAWDPECAAAFIAKWEGFREEAYQCAAGVWTIGFGHTGTVSEGDRITREQAFGCLISDIRASMMGLAPFVNREVTMGQFIALTSLAYNIGATNVVQKCPKLMAALNGYEDEECARQFLDIDKANGVRIEGLTKRRQAEARMFLGK